MEKILNKIMSGEPVTLRQWNHAREYNESLPVSEQMPIMQHEEGSDLDDVMVHCQFINPENRQHLQNGYVPETMAELLSAEIQLTRTDRHHSWKSEITTTENRIYGNQESAEAEAIEFCEKWNKTNGVTITYQVQECDKRYSDDETQYKIVFTAELDWGY